MKKFLSMVLCLAMILTCLPTLGFASDTPTGGITGLEEYLQWSKAYSTENYIGIPIDVYTYYDAQKNPEETTFVIYYVINTNTERVGMETDLNILSDLIDKGYVCVVVDYKNNVKATGSDLDYSLYNLRSRASEFKNGIAHKDHREVILPAGYSVKFDEYYWSFDKHGADGCFDQIVNVWNNDFRGVFGDTTINYPDGTSKKVSEVTATSIYDCVKQDGSPLDMDLKMDICYPVNPKEKVPVYMLASSWETRIGAMHSNAYSNGLMFRGYAFAVYDYAYVPMSRTDHYGYFDGDGMGSSGGVTGDNYTYSLGAYTQVKSDTAAVRKLRWLADYESDTYKFDVDKFGVYGGSKAGHCLYLGSKDPTKIAEDRFFVGHHGETRYENGLTSGDGKGENGTDIIRGGEVQPWLTYQDGSPIASNVQFVYGAVGSGQEEITDGHCAIFNTAGNADGSWYAFNPQVIAQAKAHNIPTMNLRFAGLGHGYVKYMEDMDYGVNGYEAFFDMANYYLKNEGAVAEYIDLKSDKDHFDAKGEITVKFSGGVSESEIKKVVIKSTATGEIANGTWESQFGDTEWTFKPYDLKGGYEYSIVVPNTIVCKNTSKLKNTLSETFKVETEEHKNATVVESDKDMTLLKQASSDDAVYLMFDGVDFKNQASVQLRFYVENDAANSVLVYAISEYDEDNIKNSTCGELLGEIVLNGKGMYDFDVSEHVKNLSDDKAGFILKSKNTKETKTVANYDFENSNVGDSAVSGLTLSTTQVKAVSQEKANSGSNSLKISYSVDSNYKDGKYHVWIDKVQNSIQISNFINGKTLTEQDKGRKFNISFNVCDTKERNVYYEITPIANSSTRVVDFDSLRYTNKTKKDEWANYSFDYRIDDDNDISLNKQSLQVRLNSSTEEEAAPVYIDDIKITEQISDVVISNNNAAPLLVLHPMDTKETYPTDVEYVDSSEKDVSVSDSVYVSGRLLSTIGNKTYIKLDISNYESGRAYFGFETSDTSKGKLKIYALTDKEMQNWSMNTINYFNAPANDRFKYGTDESKSFLNSPIVQYELSGNNKYATDVTNAAKIAKQNGSDFLTLVLVSESSDTNLIVYEDFNASSLTTQVYLGGGIKGYGRDYDNNRSGDDGSSYFMRCTQYGYERVMFDLMKDVNISEENIGRKFRLTYYVKANMAGTYTICLNNKNNAGNMHQQKLTGNAINEVGKWQKMTYEFEYTQSLYDYWKQNASGKDVYAVIDFEGLQAGMMLYIDDMTLEEIGLDKITVKPIDDVSVPTVVSNIDFDEWTLGNAVFNNDLSEVNATKNVAGSGLESATVTKITSDCDVTGGKSFLFKPNQYWNRLKFYNIFDHNLTQEDLGRKVNISFKVKSDNAGTFKFGLMSTYPRSDTSSNWAVCEGYTADKSDYATTLYNQQIGNITEAEKGQWKTFSFDVTVDEVMLAKKIYKKADTSVTKDIAVALLGIIPSKELCNQNIYIDDILVTEESQGDDEQTQQPYIYSQDFENVENKDNITSVDGCEMRYIISDNVWLKKKNSSDPAPSGKSLKFIDTYEISSEENHGSNGSKSLKLTSHVNWNRFRLTDVVDTLDSSIVGKTYKISFYVKANQAKSIKVGMVAKTSTKYTYSNGGDSRFTLYSPQTFEISAADTWQKITYTIKVDDEMVNAHTDTLMVTPVFGQKLNDVDYELDGVTYSNSVPENTAVVYIDDLYAEEVVENASVVLSASEYATVSASGTNTSKDKLTVSGKTDTDTIKGVKKAYLKFDSNEEEQVYNAVLKFSVTDADTQTIKVWGITSDNYPEKLTYANAPASEDDENMNESYVYNCKPLAVINLNGPNTYEVDVTDYIKANLGKDNIFAFTCEEASGNECTLVYENGRFTKDLDYALFGENASASINSGVVTANGEIAFLNSFENGNAAKIGKKYKLSADVESINGGEVTIAAVDKAGEIKESASYSLLAENKQNIELEFTALSSDIYAVALIGENFKVSNVTVKEETSVQIDKSANSLTITVAKEAEVPTVEKSSITINTNGTSVKADGSDIGESSTKEYVKGSSVALEAVGDGTFMYWKDTKSGAILSYDKEYTLSVGSDRSIIAIFADDTGVYVMFKNANGIVLAEGLKDSVNVPQNPYIYGYEFLGWYTDDGKTDLTAGDSVDADKNTVYTAGYEKAETEYTVTVDGAEGTYKYNDKVTVSAPETKDGNTFSYWKRDGVAVSYNKDYSFYVAGNTELTSVYGEGAEAKNVLVMATPVMVDSTRLAFFTERNIAKGNTVIESGVLIGNEANLTIDTAAIKAVAKNTDNKGQYTVRKKNVSSGQTWYGRAYVIYKDVSGNVHTIYSNEVTKTID